MASYRRRGRTWSTYWYATDPATGERKQRSKGGFRTMADAKAWRLREDANALRGVGSTPEDLTVTEFVARYIDSRPPGKPSDGTLYHYRRDARLYIDPYIGHIPVVKLDKQTVQWWHRQLMQRPTLKGGRTGLAPRTIRNAHTLLSSAFNEALNDGVVTRNPCRGVTPPRVPRSKRTRLSEVEVRRFLSVADTHNRLGLLYRLGLFTLLRPGELLALKWDDIDWRRSTVRVDATRSQDAMGRFVLGERAKTESSHRTIAVTDDVMARLRAHRARQNEHRLQYTELWHDNDLVFARDNGTMIGQKMLADTLTRLCTLAGVPRVTPHELRGTGATLMVENNEHLKVISERLGHSSISVTADIYLSVSEGMQREASARLERLFTGS